MLLMAAGEPNLEGPGWWWHLSLCARWRGLSEATDLRGSAWTDARGLGVEVAGYKARASYEERAIPGSILRGSEESRSVSACSINGASWFL